MSSFVDTFAAQKEERLNEKLLVGFAEGTINIVLSQVMGPILGQLGEKLGEELFEPIREQILVSAQDTVWMGSLRVCCMLWPNWRNT